MALGPYLRFGGGPNEPLPDLGMRIARHTKANMKRVKSQRLGLRVLSKSRFQRVDTIAALAHCLFGIGDTGKPGPATATS